MDINQKIVAFLAGLVLLGLVLRLLKRERLHPSFAALWIGISVFLMSMPILGGLYRWLALHVIGVTGGDHVVYISMIGFLTMYVFYLTGKLCSMIDQITKLISTVAMLETRQREILEKINPPTPGQNQS